MHKMLFNTQLLSSKLTSIYHLHAFAIMLNAVQYVHSVYCMPSSTETRLEKMMSNFVGRKGGDREIPFGRFKKNQSPQFWGEGAQGM